MLSNKDLDKIRQIVKEEIRNGNTVREVTIERTNNNGTKELKTIDLYIPDWIAAELPNLAAALRGVQETSDHAKNNSLKTALAVKEIFEKIEQRLIDGNNELKKALSYTIESDS